MAAWYEDELNFEITGTLTKKRKDIIEWLQSDKINFTHTSLKNADILIVGENPGSKLMKAISKKVQIIYEEDLYTHLGDIEVKKGLGLTPAMEWYKNLSREEKDDINHFYFGWDQDLEIFAKKHEDWAIEEFSEDGEFIDWLKGKPVLIKEAIPSCGDGILVVLKDLTPEEEE